MKTPAPGEYDGMPNDDYHSTGGYSSSHIKTMAAEGPFGYFHEYLAPKDADVEEEEASSIEKAELILGSAIHTAVLEPDMLKHDVLVTPPYNLRTKDGRAMRDAFHAEHNGKIIVSPDQYKIALAVRDAVYKHPIASKLFTSGWAERSTFAIDPETGELVKCRPDWEAPHLGAIVDLKSTRSPRSAGFAKEVVNLNYDYQPPWYLDVLEAHRGEAPRNWIWLAVGKVLPIRVNVFYEPPEDIAFARDRVRENFGRILECKRTGNWPGDTEDEIQPLHKPNWARR